MSGQSERDRYTSYRASARRRGLAFRLTIEQFQDIRRQPCLYGGGTSPAVRVGIDRRDNAKGYTVQNSLPCCNRHNEMRSHFFTHKEMIFIVQNVKSAAICGSNNAGRKKLSRDMPVAE